MSGDADAVATVESCAEVIVPFAVLAELRGGFANGNRRAANDRILDAFLKKPFVSPIYADEETISVYAELFSELRRQGRVIPQNDLWIAAICVQHALVLYTRDKHFEYMARVQRI